MDHTMHLWKSIAIPNRNNTFLLIRNKQNTNTNNPDTLFFRCRKKAGWFSNFELLEEKIEIENNTYNKNKERKQRNNQWTFQCGRSKATTKWNMQFFVSTVKWFSLSWLLLGGEEKCCSNEFLSYTRNKWENKNS